MDPGSDLIRIRIRLQIWAVSALLLLTILCGLVAIFRAKCQTYSALNKHRAATRPLNNVTCQSAYLATDADQFSALVCAKCALMHNCVCEDVTSQLRLLVRSMTSQLIRKCLTLLKLLKICMSIYVKCCAMNWLFPLQSHDNLLAPG